MGKKSNELAVELAMSQSLLSSVGQLLGIEVDIDLPLDARYMANLFTRYSTAIDSLRKLATIDEDAIREQPADAGPSSRQPQAQPSGGGTITELARREQEQPRDDEDMDHKPGSDVDMLREENANLRLSLQEKMDALSDAHLVLNSITGAVGLDRWTPDGQQVLHKIGVLRETAATPRSITRLAKCALLSLAEARAEIDLIDVNKTNEHLRPLSESGLAIRTVRAHVINAISDLEKLA